MFVETPAIWVSLVVGLLAIWAFWRTRRNYLAFAELKPSGSSKSEELDVTVIIPARNEAKNISRCVRSLAGQCRVLVVDDGSTDATAKLAREAGAEVIAAPALKRNTLGKPSACYAAFEHTTTRWLLFVDADTRFKAEFLPALIGHARVNSLAMISLFLKRENSNLLSALVMPYAYALYFAGVNAARIHTLTEKDALANGQCLLLLRDPYQFSSGHRAILNEVLDDIEMGRLAKRHRLKFQIMRGEKLGSVRMGGSSLEAWRAMMRNTIRLLAYDRAGALASGLTALLPYCYAPLVYWLWTQVGEEEWVQTTLYAFAALYFLPFLAWYKNPLFLFVPIVSHLFPIIPINAARHWLLGKPSLWKARKIERH